MSAAPRDAASLPTRGECRPSRVRIWWVSSRPKTLPAAATPVIVGLACAYASQGIQVASAVATLFGALLLQVAANFANDVFDYEKGADTDERVGPTRAVQAGWVSPRQMRRALYLTLLLALACGAYLVSVAGPIVVAIGLGSMLAAVAYTGGPYPLGYHGLGDAFVFVFFGFVAVAGTVFVQLGEVSALAWACSVPIGALSTNILVVNNVRDAPTDARAGKRTLVVRLGRGFGILEYRLLLSAAYASLVYLWSSGMLNAWSLLGWLTAPFALRVSRRLAGEQGAKLNPVLAASARLLALFGLLLSLAIVVGAR